MVKRFQIKNFKSLTDFSLPGGLGELGQFTCLVGLNGAGKSSVLQAFDFIGQLASGTVSEWLALRDWKQNDLTSRLASSGKKRISFALEFQFDGTGRVTWEGEYSPATGNCTRESIHCDGQSILQTKGRGPKTELQLRKSDQQTEIIPLSKLRFEGSSLSLLRPDSYHPALGLVRAFSQKLTSLELLSPQAMRKRARVGDQIGLGGERLAGYFHSLSEENKGELNRVLSQFYPQFKSLSTRTLRSGWNEIIVNEDWNGQLDTRARHVNDGLLRLAAILSQLGGANSDVADQRLLLLDEIENGINPEVVKLLIEKLTSTKRQVLLTTHSPIILNWLPDDLAKESVILLYRNSDGSTKAVRFFDLPTAAKRLGVLGAGEAFVDVSLAQMSVEAEQQEGHESPRLG